MIKIVRFPLHYSPHQSSVKEHQDNQDNQIKFQITNDEDNHIKIIKMTEIIHFPVHYSPHQSSVEEHKDNQDDQIKFQITPDEVEDTN